MKTEIHNLEQLKSFARTFLREIEPKKMEATIVALSGDLGSGKTAFVKMAAEFFGIQESVTSPTFVILKSYSLNAKRFTLLHHIDAYRLKNSEELLRLGFREILSDPKNIIFIEWPENVGEAIPKDALMVSFEFVDENTRKISF